MPQELTYDSQFQQTPPNPWEVLETAKKSKGVDISYGITDFGQNITDDSYIHQDYDWYNAFDVNEERAQNQPISHKVARGIGRVGVEIATNVLQMPGYIGGAVAGSINALAGGEGSMDMFVNNAWVDSLESVKDYYNNELAPVHIKNAVRDGNLWDNISSIDFWATEGASGLAFLISAFAPGAAVTRFGTGLKLARALGKSNLFGKGSGLRALQKADKLAVKAGFKDLKDGINVVSATVANTLYEAGVEADGALESVEQEIETKYQNGEINYGQYLELKQRAPRQAANVFRDNLGILLLPNLMMSKALFGKANPKNVLNNFEVGQGRILPVKKALTKGQKVGNISKTVGKAFVSEGLIEELGQSTSESYHTDGYIEDYLTEGEEGKSFLETYLDVIGTTEGQKALFLGTFFGSGAYAFGNHRSKKARKKQEAKLAELMTTGVNFFESAINGIYEKDENGKIVFENGEPKVNTAKVAELGSNIDFINKINEQKSFYQLKADLGEAGAQEKVDILNKTIVNNMLYSFVHAGKEGIAVLKNYLESSPGADNLFKQLNDNAVGPKKTKAKFVNELVTEAETLRTDLEHYKAYGSFKNNLIQNVRDLPYYNEYNKMVANKYAAVKSNLRYLDTRKEALNKAKEVANKDYELTVEQQRVNYIQEIKNNNTVKQLKEIAKDLGLTGYSRLRKQELAELIEAEEKIEYAQQENDVIKKLEKEETFIQELVDSNKAELKGIADAKKQDKLYKKYKATAQAREKAEKEAKELDKYLDQIRATTNEAELTNLSLPNKYKKGPALKAINKVKQEQLELFRQKKAKEIEDQKKDSEKNLTDEEIKIAEHNRKLENIKNNYEKGEQIPIDDLDIPEGYDIFEGVEGNIATFSNSEGETVEVEVEKVIDTLGQDRENNTIEPSTEVDTFTQANEPSDSMNDDARVVITDNKKTGPVKPLFSDLAAAYRFEVSPKDKRGRYNISINPAVDNKTTKKYREEGVTEENFDEMVDNLSLSIILEGDTMAPIENKPKEGKDSSIFDKTTKKLKHAILSELKDGTKIEDITVRIKGQYPGVLQTDIDQNGLPIENAIHELHYFEGNLDNITEKDFFFTNEVGNLLTIDNKAVLTNRQDYPGGEIYLRIKRADGVLFPLKLNTRKVNKKEADFLHSLFSTRAKEYKNNRLSEEGLGKNNKLSPAQLKRFKRDFPEEYKLITDQLKSEKDLNIKHVTDFFIYDNTLNPKSRVRFLYGQLHIGEEVFTKEELLNGKEGFIRALTSVKRRQITVKPSSKNKSYNLSLTNKAYRDYLIKNKILNTNAKLSQNLGFTDANNKPINDPSFLNRTTMYIDIRSVQVNGKDSSYNAADKATFEPKLFGSNTTLKDKFPKLFEDQVQLDEEAGVYLTAKDREAVATYIAGPPSRTKEEIIAYKKKKGKKRVSTLKPYIPNNINESYSKAGKVRGDVVDVLIREFFSPLQELNTNDRFAKRAMELLDYYSKKHGIQLLINEDYFKTKLWPVVKKYGELFDEAGYTVYSSENPVSFKLGPNSLKPGDYTGTGDLLVYDNKNKQWGLIDIKTSSKNREILYDNEKYSYKKGDLYQQNAYVEGYKNAGINIAFTKIMPITMSNGATGQPRNYVGEKATVSVGVKNTTPQTLEEHLITVPNDKSISTLVGEKEISNKGLVDDLNPDKEEPTEMDEESMAAISKENVDFADSLAGFVPADKPEENTSKEEPKPQPKPQPKPAEVAQDLVPASNKEYSIVQITKNNVTKRYIVVTPQFAKNADGLLEAVAGGQIHELNKNGKPVRLVTDKQEYYKILDLYDQKTLATNAEMFGEDVVRIGKKSRNNLYKINTGQKISNSNIPSPPPSEPGQADSEKVTIAKIKKLPKEEKEEVKKDREKAKKIPSKKEQLLSMVTEENAIQIFKEMKNRKLINASNIKMIGSLRNKAGSNQVKFVRDIINYMLEVQKKSLENIKNCI